MAKKILNRSKGTFEKAVLIECPKCRGNGVYPCLSDNTCSLCKGVRDVWHTDSGWCLPKYTRGNENTQLY